MSPLRVGTAAASGHPQPGAEGGAGATDAGELQHFQAELHSHLETLRSGQEGTKPQIFQMLHCKLQLFLLGCAPRGRWLPESCKELEELLTGLNGSFLGFQVMWRGCSWRRRTDGCPGSPSLQPAWEAASGTDTGSGDAPAENPSAFPSKFCFQGQPEK